MQCKCKYFKLAGGLLVCSVCGKPANTPSAPVIEDKNVLPEENKASAAIKHAAKKRK
jgi:uncharacterized Zn finger protein (UPF0148 family)